MRRPTAACLHDHALMKAVIALTMLLVSIGPVWDQTMSGPELRGRIEQITDSELIVRGEDGRRHFVDTAAIPSAELGAPLDRGHAGRGLPTSR